MSIKECLDQINTKPEKQMPARKLEQRVKMLQEALANPHEDSTEQFRILKGILLCGFVRKPKG